MKVPGKKYLFIAKNSFLESNLSYFNIALSLLFPLIDIAGLIFLYSYITADKNGFLTKEVIIYFTFVLIAASLDFRRFGSRVQEHIIEEMYLNIDKMPINPFFYYFFESIGKNFINLTFLLIVGQIVLAIYQVNPIAQLMLLPSVGICLLLGHLIYYNYALLTFYDEKTFSLWFFGIFFDFLSGKLVPLGFLPGVIQTIFLSFMPFVYAAGAIAKQFSEFNLQNLLTSLGIALIWIMILFFLSQRTWRYGNVYFQQKG
jgi:ABC-type uncharacterized transport system permease subunit